MAESFATPDDLEARWRPLTPAEESVAEVLLDDASMMIRERWSDVDSRLENETLSYSTVIRIVCGMVKRSMIAPDDEGVESHGVTTGPFADTRKFANPNGNLYLSANDIRTLDGFNTRTARMGWLA